MLNLKVFEMDAKDLPKPNAAKSNVVAHPSVLSALTVQDTNKLSWVVVERGGFADEKIVREFAFYWQAAKFVNKSGEGDIMKRLADGSLTCEF